MSKHSRIFLMISTLIFSFLFIGKVNAAYKVYNGVTYDEAKITDLAKNAFNNQNFNPDNYYTTCFYAHYNNPKDYFECYFTDKPFVFTGKSGSNPNYVFYDYQYIDRAGYYFLWRPDLNNFSSKNSNFHSYNGFVSITKTGLGQQNLWTNYDINILNTTYNSNLLFHVPMYTYNFYLNGGILENNQIEFITGEDFSLSLYQNEFEDFINNSTLEKKDMIFENWYYDEKLTHAFSIYDTITSDIDLYAKYRYKTAEDYINKHPFIDYDFDQNYDFALINRGDRRDDVYIALPFNVTNLEIYEYDESTQQIKEEASACLVPIYKKDNYYYYNINTLFTNNQEILVLPKKIFEDNNNYHFLLSNNAYINYTNSLDEAIIIDSTGQQRTIDIKGVYEQNSQYRELFEDKSSAFNLMKAKINEFSKLTSIYSNLFQYTYNSLNESIQAFLIFIFFVIIFMSIVSLLRRF